VGAGNVGGRRLRVPTVDVDRNVACVTPRNRKAGLRRLVEMSATTDDQPWAPELPAVDEFEQEFPIGDSASYVQRLGLDERDRVAEWAVIQMRKVDSEWRRVVVYDCCHGKGLHVHHYNREGMEFAEVVVRPVNSYSDFESALDYALERVTMSWQENERRSDRGY
jgi:hypothetical protein